MELDPMIDLIKLYSMYCQPQNLTKTKRDLILLLYYLTDSGNKLKNQSQRFDEQDNEIAIKPISKLRCLAAREYPDKNVHNVSIAECHKQSSIDINKLVKGKMVPTRGDSLSECETDIRF